MPFQWVTVKVPAHLWKRVKRDAGANGIKLYEFVRCALEYELLRLNRLEMRRKRGKK